MVRLRVGGLIVYYGLKLGLIDTCVQNLGKMMKKINMMYVVYNIDYIHHLLNEFKKKINFHL